MWVFSYIYLCLSVDQVHAWYPKKDPFGLELWMVVSFLWVRKSILGSLQEKSMLHC